MPLIEFENLKQPVYTYPKPQIKKLAPEDKAPSEEMRKWLLEGHKNELK